MNEIKYQGAQSTKTVKSAACAHRKMQCLKIIAVYIKQSNRTKNQSKQNEKVE